MRKCFLIVFISFTFFSVRAQRLDTLHKNVPVEVYLKRRATFNTTGWILLGVGVAAAGYSYLNYASNDFNGTWELEPLFYIGGGMALASVPFFILAKQNKTKATLALKEEQLLPATVLLKLRYPCLAIQVHF